MLQKFLAEDIFYVILGYYQDPPWLDLIQMGWTWMKQSFPYYSIPSIAH